MHNTTLISCSESRGGLLWLWLYNWYKVPWLSCTFLIKIPDDLMILHVHFSIRSNFDSFPFLHYIYIFNFIMKYYLSKQWTLVSNSAPWENILDEIKQISLIISFIIAGDHCSDKWYKSCSYQYQIVIFKHLEWNMYI